jgi:hypothetical protein
LNLDVLFHLLQAAKALCGHREYVLVGSLSVLGMAEVAGIPSDMTMSIDADCFTLADPGRVFELKPALGEGSSYHREHGIYLDPVSPRLPTLPEDWQQRLIRLERGGIVAAFLDPNDAAVSKLARAEPRDLRWVRAGIRAEIVSAPVVRLRMKSTLFLDDVEKQRAQAALAAVSKSKASRKTK